MGTTTASRKTGAKRAGARRRGTQAPAPLLVVGVVGSAGALGAYERFLAALPRDSGLAIVIVPHLDPHRESLMTTLLARRCALRVSEIGDGESLAADRVYVVPPNRTLQLNGGVAVLAPLEPGEGSQVVLDLFLRSLAQDRRERAVAIVLSGMGRSGAAGARAVKAHGGSVFVQNPAGAEYDSMPRATIEAGVADHVLDPEEMPRALLALAAHERAVAAGEAAPALTDPLHERLLDRLRAYAQADFRSFERGAIARRVQQRMALHDVDSVERYIERYGADARELRTLARDLRVAPTAFFAEAAIVRELKANVLPALVSRRAAHEAVRIWVPRCGTGEEAYSLAMLAIERAELQPGAPRIQVFATETDADALAVARAGVYPAAVMVDVDAARRARFFVDRGDGSWQVGRSLRERVTFSLHHLLADVPFSRIDLISARHVLVALEPAIRARVLELFHFALSADGYLLLDSADAIDEHADLFAACAGAEGVYRRLASPRRAGAVFPIEPRARGEPSHGLERHPHRAWGLGSAVARALLEACVPASVAVDGDGYVVALHGPVHRFLELPAGDAMQPLAALARHGLRKPVQAAVRAVLARKSASAVERGRVSRDGRESEVRITARVLAVGAGVGPLVLVSFEDDDGPPPARGGGGRSKRGADRDLRGTRRALESTVGELERTNEALRVSNEEVVSINEELQSTNEELAVSQEELMSLNEELATVNRQLQEKLDELEETSGDLACLLASTETPTVFLGRDRTLKRFTAAAARTFRLVASDTGRRLDAADLRLDDADLDGEIERVLKWGVSREREVRGDDGRWYLRRLTPYRTADRRTEGVVLTLVDVTSAKDEETALREHNVDLERRVSKRTAELSTERNFAAAVFDTAAALIVVFDPEARVVRCNRACEELTGRTLDEARGRPLWALGVLPEDEVDAVRAVFARLRAGEPTVRQENSWIAHDGSRRRIAWVSTVIRDESGALQYVVRTGIDVTEQRRAEAEARQHLEALSRAHRVMTAGELAATLAHELNQPLAAIANLGAASLRLLEGPSHDGALLGGYLRTIVEQTQRAGRVIGDLRAFLARGAAERMPVDLNAVVAAACDLAALEAAEHGVAIERDLGDGELKTNGAPLQLEHAIVNLLQNAIEALRASSDGTPGRIVVRTRAVADGSVEVRVADNGPGIAPDAAERIFEPLFTTKHDGLGMGLAICRSVVEAFGGRIGLDGSAAGRGAVFVLSLPLEAS